MRNFFQQSLSILLLIVAACVIVADALWFCILEQAPRAACVVLGAALLLLATRILSQGVAAFRRSGTHLVPYKPALVLVTGGIFAKTRNPMYQGVAILVAGLAILLRTDALLLLLVAAPLIHFTLVLPEERYLSRKFSARYLQFTKEVPRYAWLAWPSTGHRPLAKDWLVWAVAASALMVVAYTGRWVAGLAAQAMEAPGSRATALARSPGLVGVSLLAAAREVGLRRSADVSGTTDAISRSQDGGVNMHGWAADVAGNGSPLNILVFSNGMRLLETKTAGSRPDVTRELKLAARAAGNVAFSGTLACHQGQRLTVVAATMDGKYAPLPTVICP